MTVPQVENSPREDVPSALQQKVHPDFPDALIDPNEVFSGGPPPDGIPPVDTPRFLTTEQVDFLEDDEPVLALSVGDEARAYPVQILTWHEIVNDSFGEVPVAVTYCPLCNSAIAYDRRVDGKVLDFGTSGSLYRSAMVMYDRQTESLWTHYTGEAVIGHLAGARLEDFAVSMVAWEDYRKAHPGSLVLSRQTGHQRDYGRNPYVGYDEAGSDPFAFRSTPDGRLPPKARIVGVGDDRATVAIPTARFAEEPVVEFELRGDGLVVFWKAGTTSALDEGRIADGRDVGATGVFRREVEGRDLTFSAQGENFVDAETSTTWDILGRGISGPLSGRQLDEVSHIDTFWFAWAAYRPDTRILG